MAQMRRIRKRNLEAKKKFVGSLLSEVFDFNPTCFTLARLKQLQYSLGLGFFILYLDLICVPTLLKSLPMEVLMWRVMLSNQASALLGASLATLSLMESLNFQYELFHP